MSLFPSLLLSNILPQNRQKIVLRRVFNNSTFEFPLSSLFNKNFQNISLFLQIFLSVHFPVVYKDNQSSHNDAPKHPHFDSFAKAMPGELRDNHVAGHKYA
jgi:hypothetical protein